MARGIMSGALVGTVLSVGGLGALSIMDGLEQQAGANTQAVPVDVAGVEDDAPASESDRSTGDAVNADASPEPDAVASDTVEAPDAGAAPTVTAQVDETTVAAPDAQDAPDRPADTADAPNVNDETPNLAAPTEADQAVPDATVAAPQPEPDAAQDLAALQVPTSPQPSAEVAPSPVDENATAPDAVPALEEPRADDGPVVDAEPTQPPEPSQLAGEAAPDSAAADEETSTDTAQAETEEDRPQVIPLVPEAPVDDNEGAAEAATEDATPRPTIGRPATSLVDRDTEGTSRLPSIGTAGEETPAPTSEASDADTRPPLERFAADYEATDPGLPRMSVVLIDDGTGPLGPDTLDNFPFPVTFALDPSQPNAAQRMADYRALGYEVATLADLPDGAQPSDVEQILAGAIAAVPEAVALIEAPGGRLQAERSSTEQVTRFVSESGHGLVFLPNGLNTAEAIARSENVPALSVLRDFDGDGQDARTKRRFLDGAAFRARQDGNVVMLGRLTADTVSSLLLWSLQDRASSVAMVPVSAILRASSG